MSCCTNFKLSATGVKSSLRLADPMSYRSMWKGRHFYVDPYGVGDLCRLEDVILWRWLGGTTRSGADSEFSPQPVWGFWLVPHRAPPQVADRGTLSKIGEYEDLFLRRTKTSHNLIFLIFGLNFSGKRVKRGSFGLFDCGAWSKIFMW